MSPQFFDDPELADILAKDPSLREIGGMVHDAARVEPAQDPRFRTTLRRELMVAAQRELRPRLRWWSLTPARIALGGVGLGAALAATAAVLVISDHRGTTVQTPTVAFCSVCGSANVPVAQTITVGFSVPMDHASVESGLTIQPAVAHQASWDGNQLLLTPTHQLSANTSYIITINHSVARAATGGALQADVYLTFGTAPTPAPSPPPTPTPNTGPPSLHVSTAGSVAPGTQLFFGPDGALYGSAPANSTSLRPSATPAATTTPSPTSLPTPSATGAAGTPTPLPSPSPTSSAGPATVAITRFSGGGSPATIAAPAISAAISPDGSSVAFLQAQADGSTALLIASSDGTNAHIVATVTGSNSALAWTADGSVHFVSDGRLQALDTSGKRHTLTAQQIADGQVVVWSADGRWAYVGWSIAGGNSGDGLVVNLGTGHTRTLQGARERVAFSADGAQVAWSDLSDPSNPRLDISATGALNWLYIDSGQIGDIALDATGARVAYIRNGTGVRVLAGDGKQVVAEFHGSNPLAHPVWSPLGERLAFVNEASDTAQTSTVPGSSFTSVPSIAAAANTALNAFTGAQVAGATATLGQLAPGVDPATYTPAERPDRRYTVSAVQGGTTLTARVRLVQDATGNRPARYADETVTLTQRSATVPVAPGSAADGGWLVSAVQLGEFAGVRGPQVTGVTSASAGGTTTIMVSFDSDLDPQSIPGAFLVSAGGTMLDATVAYHEDSRTVTITVPSPAQRRLQLVVGTSLHDVSATPAQRYETSVAL